MGKRSLKPSGKERSLGFIGSDLDLTWDSNSERPWTKIQAFEASCLEAMAYLPGEILPMTAT
jgi:hypothetical protein